MVSETVEEWFARRGMVLTPAGELAVIVAAGVAGLFVAATVVVGVLAVAGGLR